MNETLALIGIISEFVLFTAVLLWADFFTRNVKR
jgi:hypothetical protein